MISSSCSTTTTVLPRVCSCSIAADERPDIGRVQADGGLVEHVQHVDQARAERRGEGDALRFAAAEGSQRAIEREVSEADVLQIGQSRAHIFNERLRDLLLPVGQLQFVEERERIANFQAADIGEVLVAHANGERLGPQPRSAAGRAGDVFSPAAQEHAQVHFVLAAFEPAEEAVQAAEVSFRHAFGDQPSLFVGEFGERHIDRQLVVVGEREQLFEFVRVRRRIPGRDGAVADRFCRVGNDAIHVGDHDIAETFALGAGAQRPIEIEELRLGFRIVDAAMVAPQARC